jgi:uncharacterized Zn-binding protein involved in type VI secretion
MGQAVAQKINSQAGGGTIIGFMPMQILVEGMLISVVGDMVLPHGACPEAPIHCFATIMMGSQKVFAEGMQVARVNDMASCGDIISPGGQQKVLAG